SFEVESKISEGSIKIILNPPSRNPPKSIIVCLRNPENLKIRRAQVNGEDFENFDPEKGLINLGYVDKTMEIVAYY
ncbi:MAG: hypothetical protein QW797_06930, partial [Thermoproteota archaeon]